MWLVKSWMYELIVLRAAPIRNGIRWYIFFYMRNEQTLHVVIGVGGDFSAVISCISAGYEICQC